MKFDFVCPSARNQKCGYACNRGLSALSLNNVPDAGSMVVFFESNLGWNGSGGPGDLPASPRHMGGDVFGFLDAHAKWFPRGRQSGLVWHLPAAPPHKPSRRN